MVEKPLESLDLNLLLALHWLLSERNVTAAAGRIGVSQPAASRSLSRLREIFDDPLLVKTGGDMSPTPLAERLQPAVAHAIERCRDVLRLTESFAPETQKGRFRVACVDYVGAMVAEAWLTGVAPEAPGLDLDIVNLTVAASSDLVSGKVDLVIMPEPNLMKIPPSVDLDQFVRKPLIRQEYICAIRRGHPFAEGNITLKRYISLNHVLVTPEGARVGVVDRALEREGLERRVAFRTATFLLGLQIVKHTDCVLTMPEFMVKLDKGSFVTFPPPLDVPGYSMFGGWHPNWTHDARHRWVRDRLFAALGPVGGCAR